MLFKSVRWIWKDILFPILTDKKCLHAEGQNRAEHNCIGGTGMAESAMVLHVAKTDDSSSPTSKDGPAERPHEPATPISMP